MILIYWLIAGAIIGWLGSLLTGRGERIGCLSNMIVGEIGAVLGGLIGLALGSSMLMAFVGAIAVMGIYGRVFNAQPT